MFFKGKHLRVTTPKTTNGQIPFIENGVPQVDVTFAPLTARKALERKNARLVRTGFSHLVAKIEEISDVQEAPAPAAPKADKPKATPKAEKATPPADAAGLLAQAGDNITL